MICIPLVLPHRKERVGHYGSVPIPGDTISSPHFGSDSGVSGEAKIELGQTKENSNLVLSLGIL